MGSIIAVCVYVLGWESWLNASPVVAANLKHVL